MDEDGLLLRDAARERAQKLAQLINWANAQYNDAVLHARFSRLVVVVGPDRPLLPYGWYLIGLSDAASLRRGQPTEEPPAGVVSDLIRHWNDEHPGLVANVGIFGFPVAEDLTFSDGFAILTAEL